MKLRKNELMAGIFLFSFLLNMALVNSYFYTIKPICSNNVCIRGETGTWNIVISNDAKNDVEYTGIELLDTANNSLFASLKMPFNPLSDKRGDLIAVKANEKITVNLTGKLPKANYGQTLVYYTCFTTAITDQYIIARDNTYESRHCYNQNETMQVLECISSNNCKNDESCSFNKCLRLKCGECQYINDHKCFDYGCCIPEQCKFNEMCKNHTCQKLNCNFNEYILNHTCSLLNCANDEFIFNGKCARLNCSFTEFANNHTCKALNCRENEFIKNQTCKLLNCRENEYAKNHACIPLDCLYNETFFDHSCRPLDCWFFQDAVSHACRNNRQIIFKSSLEIIAIIVIILFFVIDFMKFEKRHKEKQKIK